MSKMSQPNKDGEIGPACLEEKLQSDSVQTDQGVKDVHGNEATSALAAVQSTHWQAIVSLAQDDDAETRRSAEFCLKFWIARYRR